MAVQRADNGDRGPRRIDVDDHICTWRSYRHADPLPDARGKRGGKGKGEGDMRQRPTRIRTGSAAREREVS